MAKNTITKNGVEYTRGITAEACPPDADFVRLNGKFRRMYGVRLVNQDTEVEFDVDYNGRRTTITTYLDRGIEIKRRVAA